MEKVKEVIVEKKYNGFNLVIAETYYEFGTHYVLCANDIPVFHSTDYERVVKHMNSTFGIKD